MQISSPGHTLRLRRPFKLVALGTSALVLAMAVACGAAEQPQEPAPRADQASQSSPAQPATQPQPAAEPAPATGSQPGESMISSEVGMKPSTEVQAQSEPAKAMTTNQPANAEVAVENTVETQPEPMAKAMEPKDQPAAEATGPAAPQQEPSAPAQPMETSPAQVSESPSTPAAAPQPAQAPAQQPTATAAPAPQPTATPVAVVVEPPPEVGNQVGNRVPDLGLELVGGSMVSTSGLIEQEKPTFLFFTSTT